MCYNCPMKLTIAFLACLLTASPSLSATSARWVVAGDTLLTGSAATGRIGDIVMENDLVRAVIGGPGHGGESAISGGNVLDIGTRALGRDLIGEQYLYLEADWPRQGQYDTVLIVDPGAGGTARVLVTGRDSQQSSLRVETEYLLAEGSSSLEIRTTMINDLPVTLASYDLGDAFIWNGAEPFLPGYGWDPPSGTLSAWLAASDGYSAIGYTDSLGSMAGEHDSGWSDLTLTVVDLHPGVPVTYTRHLIVATGGVGAVVNEIHERQGTPTGTLTAEIAYTPEPYAWLLSDVLLSDGLGLPYLSMSLTEGTFGHVTLPAGDWSLVADTPGYSDDWASFTLGVGDSLHYAFAQTYEGPIYATSDTLSIIQRPILNVPSIVEPGDLLTIECEADPATADWTAALRHGAKTIPLAVESAAYDPSTLWWTLQARLPSIVEIAELYDLDVWADGVVDRSHNAVRVLESEPTDYYFVHMTDSHLPTHAYVGSTGEVPDSTEILDLRAVIDDINIINPAFAMHTGDLVNEGELEDYLYARCYTRSKNLMGELTVPVYLIAGNHDLGGWPWTPPPDGTARKDWWRFYGWKRLADPPPGAPARTQDYTFTLGQVRYVALESYDNYDSWREEIYGAESFTDDQMNWLSSTLSASSSPAHVMFYHYDFQGELSANALGVDMMLYGHTHGNQGNVNNHPYVLGTAKTCDGGRAFRLIRVSGSTLDPQATLYSGSYGEKLRAQYIPANDGSASSVTCQLTNNFNERFEHGLLRFHLVHAGQGYEVDGPGTIVQVDAGGDHAVVYVQVDIQPNSQELITVSVGGGTPADPPQLPDRVTLKQNHPNPFNPRTEIAFGLPRAGHARLTVHSPDGREVARLVDARCDAGELRISWDGRDDGGEELASGVYLLRLKAEDEVMSRKIHLLR